MTQETDQDARDDAAPQEQPREQESAGAARAPRRRRAPKQDLLLVADAATARAAVEQITEASRIGEGHRVQVEEDRLVTHLFECTLPGYRGWNWFASLARAPRSKTVTVCEVGLLPGEDALLAPEWVPWSDRVSAEEKAQDEQDEQDPEGAGEDAGLPGPVPAPEPGAEPDSQPGEAGAGAPAGAPGEGDRS